MKKLLSCAALICAIALTGCSKGNKAGENATVDASKLDPSYVIEETRIVDGSGNVIATVEDGNYVDADGNVIGTVDAVQAQLTAVKDSLQSAADKVADKAKDVVDDAKDAVNNAVTNAKDSIAGKASELAGKASDAAAKAADDIKAGVADKLNEAGAALQEKAQKLGK